MNDPDFQNDKERCLKKWCTMPSYERNILSHGIVSTVGLGVVVLGLLKITSPFVAVGAGVLYSLAYFLHKDQKVDIYKLELDEQRKENVNLDREVRRLSYIETANSNRSLDSTGSQTVDPPVELFE